MNNIFWVSIDVRFIKPIDYITEKGINKKENVIGFSQDIGITYSDEKDVLKLIIEELIDIEERNNCEVKIDRIGIIQEKDLQKEVYEDKDIQHSLLGDPKMNGIWYKTGRGLLQ